MPTAVMSGRRAPASNDEAAAAHQRAFELVPTESEQRYLSRRLPELADTALTRALPPGDGG